MDEYKSIQLRREIDQYVEESNSWFHTYDIWRSFNVTTKDGKQVVNQRLIEHIKAQRIEKDGLRFRKIDKDMEAMDIFQHTEFVYITFPFPLQSFIRLSEGSVMVIAGASDSGKTAFCINTAMLNYEEWDVHLFNSETGVALMKERILAVDPDICNPLPFKIWDRMDNFADVIVPDALNIIDYLDIDSEIYMVGAEIKKILKALGKGVAIIGLQKPPERDLGYGGQFSLKKAECYVSMDKNKLKIVKAKSRANPSINPINKTWTFHLDSKGSNFENIQSEGDSIPF